jgi:lipopolysaccharide/colanic/teichoic acid biosynthesis glycosyltransferase
MLVFRTTPDLSWSLLVKEFIDRVGALLGLLVTSAADGDHRHWYQTCLAGRSSFRQKRSGKNGRPFVMYKFRSMYSDAAMRQAELAAFNQMSGPVFKIDKDPGSFRSDGFCVGRVGTNFRSCSTCLKAK